MSYGLDPPLGSLISIADAQLGHSKLREEKLHAELRAANETIGHLLALCIEAHGAQLHPRNSLAVRLAAAIHSVDPSWQPPESAVR